MSLISYLTTIRFQAGALSDVGSDMRELGIRTPLIVTDAGIARAGLVERLTDALSAGQHIPVFTDTPTNPTENAVMAALDLYQSHGCDRRVAKHALIRIGRYRYAHQFKRANHELRFVRARLGRVIRDVRRKIHGNAALEERFGPLLTLASRVRQQTQRQRGPKVYGLHAPEVECIGKGKARTPYEFGCKVSIATPVTQPKGGQFVLHARALHNNPYDGHTLAAAVADVAAMTGAQSSARMWTRAIAGTITRTASRS